MCMIRVSACAIKIVLYTFNTVSKILATFFIMCNVYTCKMLVIIVKSNDFIFDSSLWLLMTKPTPYFCRSDDQSTDYR